MVRLAAVGVLVVAVMPPPHSAAGGSLYQILHEFTGTNSRSPAAGLVEGTDGSLYGITQSGGDLTVRSPDGGGTVFRLDRGGNFTLLHVFKGTDGSVPTGLIQGRDGFFYGSTRYGGSGYRPDDPVFHPGSGTIFRMDSAGNVEVLRDFPGGANWLADGVQPGPIVQGADGALYGTAAGGAVVLNEARGFVYRFDPVTGAFRHLHDFVASDGSHPSGPLIQGTDGFFYGTTVAGGPTSSPGVYSGKGVVYKVDATGAFALLHAFEDDTGWRNELWNPRAGVIQASDGLLYGTTKGGGFGSGAVFRLDTSGGNFAILHRFDEWGSDGAEPESGLIQARDGNFYGTSQLGGLGVYNPDRKGVVYRMTSSGVVSVLHTFYGPDGARPMAPLLETTDGVLIGPTAVGGSFDMGVIFQVDPAAALPVASLSIVPNPLTQGDTATGTVTLTAAAPWGGTEVDLSTNNEAAAQVPPTVTVQSGSTSASFPVTTPYGTASLLVFASVNGAGISAPLTVKSAGEPPPDPPSTPAGVTATAASSSAIDVSWNDVATETSYRVERSSGTTVWATVGMTDPDVTTFRDGGLSPATTYYYRVVAMNDGGDSPPSASASATTMAETDTTPPTAPGNLKAKGAKGKVNLSWSASTDSGGSGLARYELLRSTASAGPFVKIGSVPASNTSFSDETVSSRVEYWYYAVAVDGASNVSPRSALVSARPR